MFRKMRRFKQELSIEETKQLLNENTRAAFSVIGDDGYPYTIPIDYYYDETENRIYFHGAKEGHKIDAIKKNNKVCFTTWGKEYFEEGDWACYVYSCVIFGKAVLIDDTKITEEKIRLLSKKHNPPEGEIEKELQAALNRVQLYAIDIEHMSGKKVHEK